MTTITKIYGPPGTGKTTKAKMIMDDLKKQGYKHTKHIMFTSLTNAALESITKKYGLKNIPNRFKTTHGLCLSYLMSNDDDVRRFVKKGLMNKRSPASYYPQFCRENGIEYVNTDSLDGLTDAIGNKALNYYNKAIMNYFPLYESVNKCIDKLEKNIKYSEKDYETIIYILNKWIEYKGINNIYDFTDMLIMSYIDKDKIKFPLLGNSYKDIKVLLTDESQDYGFLEWEIIKALYRNSELDLVYNIGDDYQAIYYFKGSDSQLFIENECDETIVLDKSYRLKSNILNFSNNIVNLMKYKFKKEFNPLESGGNIVYIKDPNKGKIAMNRMINTTTKSTMILTRTNREALNIFRYYLNVHNYLINTIKNPVIKMIFNFVKAYKENNFNSEYIKKYLYGRMTPQGKIKQFEKKNGIKEGKLLSSIIKENILVDTIHASKGLEADNVIYFDRLTNKIKNSKDDKEIDAEFKTAYVGCTRARTNLLIINGNKKDCGLLGNYIDSFTNVKVK